jgi:tRNA pseudouridine38-40 synthase
MSDTEQICQSNDHENTTRIAMRVEYNGKQFCGSQFQLGVATIQSEMEKAVSTLARRQVTCIFSGRTDSGVHSSGQVVHCDWPDREDQIDLWRIIWSLNGILPQAISIAQAQIVPKTFHARFSAEARQYVYRILNRPQRSALLRDTHYFISYELDLEKMQQAAAYLVGSHDFKSFKSRNSDTTTTICQVMRAEILKLPEGRLEFWIRANHFVYNMVRIIVGTLVEIGVGKSQPECIIQALNEPNRALTGPTAPSWGLSLESVEYPEAYRLFTGKQESQPLSHSAR